MRTLYGLLVAFALMFVMLLIPSIASAKDQCTDSWSWYFRDSQSAAMYGDLIQGAADRIAADQANGDLMLIDGEQANMAFLSGKLGLRERPHQHGRRCDSGLLLVLNIAHDLRVVGDPSQHYP